MQLLAAMTNRVAAGRPHSTVTPCCRYLSYYLVHSHYEPSGSHLASSTAHCLTACFTKTCSAEYATAYLEVIGRATEDLGVSVRKRAIKVGQEGACVCLTRSHEPPGHVYIYICLDPISHLLQVPWAGDACARTS